IKISKCIRCRCSGVPLEMSQRVPLLDLLTGRMLYKKQTEGGHFCRTTAG
ncbi:Hypothetical predicted protein, partial [Pelobates cultripes]